MVFKFKDFLKFSFHKENNGIEQKNATKTKGDGNTSITGNDNQQIQTKYLTINFNGEFPAEQLSQLKVGVQKNLETMIAGNEEVDMSKIVNPDHLRDVHEIINSGIKGTNKLAEQINKIIPKIVKSEDEIERRQYMDAVQFIATATEREKSFVVWTSIHLLIEANIGNLKELKLSEVSKKYPIVNPLNYSELSNLAKFGSVPNGNITRISLTKNFDKQITTDELIKEGCSSKADLLIKYPELSTITQKPDYSKGIYILNAVPFQSDTLHKAALIMLAECGLKFEE